mgnify:CR=1 FL=1
MSWALRIIAGLAIASSLLALSLILPISFVPSVAFTLAFLAILSGFVRALVCRDGGATFYGGFATFAAIYLIFSMSSVNLSGRNRISSALGSFTNEMEHEPSQMWLPTSHFLAWAYDAFGGKEMETYGGTPIPAAKLLLASPNAIPAYLDMSALQRFLATGHSMFALIAGFAGGAVAYGCARRLI